MKRRFILQFSLAIAVMLVAGTAAYFFICKGLRQAKRDAVGKFNYIITDTAYYRTVFFGTSTMRAAANTPLFDSLIGSHSFNASMDGLGIAELNMLVHKYLKCHGTPQQIFIGFDEFTMSMNKGVWYFPQYYPYVTDKDLRELVALEPKLLLGKYFPPAAVTYFDDPLKNLALVGLITDNKTKAYEIPFQGFNPLQSHDMNTEKKPLSVYYQSVPQAWQLLEQTVAECNTRKIKVGFILPPRYNYFLSDSSAPFIEKLKYFKDKYNVATFNYSTDPRFQSKDIYYDRIHLAEEGTRLFISALAKDIQNSIP